MKAPDLTSLDNLFYMADALRRAVDQQLAKHRLNYTHFVVMRDLTQMKQASPAVLAKRLGLSRAGVKKALKPLTSGDEPFVKSQSAGRAITVSLSSKGRQVYADMAEAVRYSSARVYWLPMREAYRLEDLMAKARECRDEVLSGRARAQPKTATASQKRFKS